MMRFGCAVLAAVFCFLAGPAWAVDCSGTITTGGTAQTISQINANTRGVVIMNNSANLMCIAWNGSAATIAGTNCGSGSWALQPGSATVAGGSFAQPENIKISTMSIISSTTGDRFSCERQ